LAFSEFPRGNLCSACPAGFAFETPELLVFLRRTPLTHSAEQETYPPAVLQEYAQLVDHAVDVLPAGELLRRLAEVRREGKVLRVKYGADPSAPDIHLGHAVPIRKLKQFQDLGHQVVFIIGGYTARIGDPSGRNSSRPRLTKEDVKKNAETYLDQVFRILDREKTEIVDNTGWLEPLTISDMLEIMSQFTVSQMMERDDFHRRFEQETPIFLHEFLYPLLQGYDSVAVRADIEIGGTDQKFNLLMGRELQRQRGMGTQSILTMPLLVGLDGKSKMSKSLGNYIGITEDARSMFGKTMSLPDELMGDWFRLLGGYSAEQATQLMVEVESGRLHPREAKERLAKSLVESFHSATDAEHEAAEFRLRFSERSFPKETAEVLEVSAIHDGQPLTFAKVLTQVGAAKSNREARTLLEQKSVKLFDSPLSAENLGSFQSQPVAFGTTQGLSPGEYELKIGKARFLRLIVR
jgi:tyrosyl-tRNA synthetase